MGKVVEPTSRRQRVVTLVGATRWPLLILLPGLVATFGGFAGTKRGQTRVYFILVTVLCALILAFLNVWKEYQARRSARSAATAKIALAESINQAGKPLVSMLGKVAEATDGNRRSWINALITTTLQISAEQCGRLGSRQGQIRSVLYQFDLERNLARVDWHGRQGKAPRSSFIATQGKGDRAVIEIAEGEDFVLCRDIDQDAPVNMEMKESRPYKSFLQVPVRTDKRSFGFLAVDSDAPFSLTNADVGFVILMARLLAVSLALLDGDASSLLAERHTVPQQQKGDAHDQARI